MCLCWQRGVICVDIQVALSWYQTAWLYWHYKHLRLWKGLSPYMTQLPHLSEE